MDTSIAQAEAPAAGQGADDTHRSAWNGAFWDMGFKWQWDRATYQELCRMPEEKARLGDYLTRRQPHLLKAYELDFLIDLIHRNKLERHAALVAALASGRPPNLGCNAL